MVNQLASHSMLEAVIRKYNNKLGGGEGNFGFGFYGSLTTASFSKVLQALNRFCGLGRQSKLVDVGAGIGRPLLQALVWPGLEGALGIEVDDIKVQKAEAFLTLAMGELQEKGVLTQHLAQPEIRRCLIEQVATLDPYTHAYSFWDGIPPAGKAAFGRLFAASSTLQAVAVVQHAMRADPADAMLELGFGPVELVDTLTVRMSGSGASFTAYIFIKAGPRRASPCRAVGWPSTQQATTLRLEDVLARHLT